jgi:hypothetical protein
MPYTDGVPGKARAMAVTVGKARVARCDERYPRQCIGGRQLPTGRWPSQVTAPLL